MVQKICPNCSEPSPIACKKCRKCDHEFKKRTESEPTTVVKKTPRKPSSSSSGKPTATRTVRPPPVLPVITPEEKERALFKEVTIVNKKCTHCSAPSPIACKRCRACGNVFVRKGFFGAPTGEPLIKKPKKAASPVQREVVKEESPELPVQKTRGKLRLDSVETDTDYEGKLQVLYSEKRDHLSYILQGINDKFMRTTKITGGIIIKS